MIKENKEIVINSRTYGPVERRGGCWGWFLTTPKSGPHFIAYGCNHTKKMALERRLIDMKNWKKENSLKR